MDHIKLPTPSTSMDEFGVETIAFHGQDTVWIILRGSSLLLLYNITHLTCLLVFDVASGCCLTETMMVHLVEC